MKNIFKTLLLLLLFSCKQEHTNKKSMSTIKDSKEEVVVDNDSIIPEILTNANKYLWKHNLHDSSPCFPFSSYFDKQNGSFVISYIGKSNLIQYYWNFENTTGFFEENKLYNNDKSSQSKIKNIVEKNSQDYFKVASFLPKEYIKTNSQDEDWEISKNAVTYFYIFEKGKWNYLSKFRTSELDMDNILSYNLLIQSYLFKNSLRLSDKFTGKFTVSVEGDSTNHGMEMYEYQIDISENGISLHEVNRDFCGGSYKGIEKDNKLELYYIQDKDERCVRVNSNYTIKKEGEKFYIKGSGGEGTFHQWIELKKVNKFE